MNTKNDFEKLTAMLPQRYHVDALELLYPYLIPEMTWEINNYLMFFKREPTAPIDIVKIIFKLVGELTGVLNVRDTKIRTHTEVTARQLAMYALYYEIPNFSLGKVGQCFTHAFNHATVLNAHRTIECLYATQADFRKLINLLADMMVDMNLQNLKNRLAIIKTI